MDNPLDYRLGSPFFIARVEPDIYAFCERQEAFTMRELIDELGLNVSHTDQRATKRIGAILRALGWKKKRLRAGGKCPWVWYNPVLTTVDTLFAGKPIQEGGE